MKGFLNGAVQMIVLQFSFSNRRAVPEGLFEKPEEDLAALKVRKNEVRGKQFIDPTEGVSLKQLVSDLLAAGYDLVDGFFRMRTKPDGQMYPAVRFIFALPDDEHQPGEFAAHKESAMSALQQMCDQALWRVRGFLNPYFSAKDVLVEDKNSISINFEARKPLVDGNGELILQWKKDASGQKVGTGPVPIEADKFLVAREDDICVVTSL